ncbi:MAG TPA: OmpP1/FadL family transporter [Burkholderiales bacterium]|nr:OmpP1/FadL family transporter [Burkholderiales bacterium]
MKKNVLALSVASALSIFAAQQARAAGFALYEQGISGMGNAYAGAAAVAEDATTVWWNPAGMSRLPKGMHASVGVAAIAPSWKFHDNGSTVGTASNPAKTGNGGDAGDTAYVPSAFFAMDLNPVWNFGLGISVPFGLKTEYDPNWIGRFQGIKSEVQTVNINPAVSYKVSDALSLGFGVNYQRGKIDILTGVNLGPAALPASAGLEAQNQVNLDGDAWGFNMGALFNVGPATRVGVHYRSSLDYKLDGNTQFFGVPAPFSASPTLQNGNIKFDLKTPDNLAVAVAHRMNDKLELLGDFTWWHWSKIKSIPIVRTDGPISGATLSTLNFNFDDSYRVSVGANYKLSQPWTLKAGLAFDQTPVPNAESRTVRLPDSDRYWLSFGAKYQASPKDAVDVGYTYIKAKDADINNIQNNPAALQFNGNVVGTYKASVNVFGLQYQHTF